jgi:predicted nucleotidyltransferase
MDVHRVRNLALFGSELDGRTTPTDDVDLLVEFEDGLEPGFLALAGMEIELRRAEVQFAR